jgi:hypothetical protein
MSIHVRSPSDALERGVHVCVKAVVAMNAGDALIDGGTIVRREAGDERPPLC